MRIKIEEWDVSVDGDVILMLGDYIFQLTADQAVQIGMELAIQGDEVEN